MPSKVQVAKGTDALEDRMYYHNYDRYGNLTEVSYPNGMHHVYIWGYQGDHLLAEIKNASYDGLSGSVSTAIKAIQDDSDVENSTSEEDDLIDDLNGLRSSFPDSQMSVYVYDPGIGVKRISDVRGYSTYYFYDQHNRLKYVTDEDENVLSENKYNLRVNN